MNPSLPRCILAILTPHGVFLAHYSAEGLTALDFPSSRTESAPPLMDVLDQAASWHKRTSAAVTAILAGDPPDKFPPLAPEGTSFQQAVWREMRRVPLGKTLGYGDIAAAIGKPRGAQAVGQACGANPIPLLIPCHRILASGGRLGGFSGGLDWKRRLLAAEGVVLR